MMINLNRTLFKNLIFYKYAYVIIYTLALAAIAVSINDFFAMVGLCLVFMALFFKQQVKYISVSGENDIDEPAERIEVYKAFAVSLYLKILVPLILNSIVFFIFSLLFSLDIGYLTEADRLALRAINMSAFMLMATATLLYLWSRCKTVWRPIFLAASASLSTAVLIPICYFWFGSYFIGYIPNYYSEFQVLDEMAATEFWYYAVIRFLVVIICAPLFIIMKNYARRYYIDKSYKNIGLIFPLIFMFLWSVSIAMIVFSENSFTITESMIVYFIFTVPFIFILCFGLYGRSLKFKKYLIRVACVCIVSSLIPIPFKCDVFGYVGYVPDDISRVTVWMEHVEINGHIRPLEYVDIIYTFTDQDTIDKVKTLQKDLIEEIKKQYIPWGNYLRMFFSFKIEYNTGKGKKVVREYLTSYDYYDDPSILMPLITSPEFRQMYFKAIESNENKAVYLGDPKNRFSRLRNKVYNSDELSHAILADAKSTNLEYLLKSETVYSYTISYQYIDENGKPHMITYFIPQSFKNTIDYIESHYSEISDE